MECAAKFNVPVRLRCCERQGFGVPSACGRAAHWERDSAEGFPAGYFCDEHKRKGDRPVPESHLVNRVSIQAEIVFSGTSFAAAPAQSEALEALRAALERAGGVLNLVTVRSVVGRYEAPPARRRELVPSPPARRPA